MKLNQLTLTKAIELLKSKQISLDELYTDIEEAIAAKNKELNIYLAMNETAREDATHNSDLPLAGVPIAVKDNFLTKGLTTTASAKVLKDFIPPYESTVTKKLFDAGGVVIGKTNMDAWAHGSSTETSDFGPTKNPRNPAHLPGGSSGGSAAAVAADLCIAALGTETAGSIRQPAAWCGIVGMKPTYGRVSRYGVVAMGSSLDSPGPMGKTVEDCALLFSVIAGHDPLDATSAPKLVPDGTKTLAGGVKGMRVGICYIDHPNIKGTIVDGAVRDAAKIFENLGARVSDILLSDTLVKGKILKHDYAVSVYTVVQRSEVSSNLARYDGIRYGGNRGQFGEEAKRRIMLGTFTLTRGYAEKYYVRAQLVRNLYIQNFRQLFKDFDILISASSPSFALPLGATSGDPMFGELQDMLAEPSSLAGLPGINVPCYRDPKTNLFLGLNIMADHWQEETVFRAAHAYEQATEWNSWKNL